MLGPSLVKVIDDLRVIDLMPLRQWVGTYGVDTGATRSARARSFRLTTAAGA